MLMQKLLASAGGVDKLYIDDLFQAYVRTGTGASATVTTGINLLVKGGMIWSKGRSGATDHAIYDTTRGATFDLASNLTSAQTTQAQGLTAFGATGHTWGTLAKVNTNAATYVDYVFAKAPKFFDVVTYTGNGASSRAIAHSLGQEVGMVMTKATSTTGDWNTYHRSATGDLVLNTTAVQTGSKALVNSATTTTFTVSGAANTNAVTYVAYLFAHDPSADGIIQCGGFAPGVSSVTLGWEPQFVICRAISTSEDWRMWDTMRGMPNQPGNNYASQVLLANTSGAETTHVSCFPNANGFSFPAIDTNQTYIYLAIRRPNKPPTTGTEVYNAIARTGTGAAATVTGVGFAPDLVLSACRPATVTGYKSWYSRLQGVSKFMLSNNVQQETADTGSITAFNNSGVVVETSGMTNAVSQPYINHFFKRAPGVFDTVCYTGTGVAKTEAHSLGVAPELMIVKSRNNATNWFVYSSAAAANRRLFIDNNWGYDDVNTTDATIWNNTTPTATQFSIGGSAAVSSTWTYVAYLFASVPGISKVGSYTGNGTTQTINCGFTTGARFVMIKRTDAAGDWYVWDTVRGLVAGNDPHLSLNSTTVEITTDDSLDPASVGFIVNQLAATNINVTSASYIYLSFA